ncbi:M24 family metallopeptidase [Sedimentibacter hydroxybenzoicus DSM 7310]|uniref:M24 family metallopeptidase n=1 Tax=Sedimentibacter hydroxybenzoicus DSM 7310 TaxID=1123245 RepID=A0A974BN77_SEDHY|nr:M24 family metallopeptidase [Sedimentibacter hydroxybenzoicus]NYB75872.1 M24 family metallopeptidase [Sedimentibacter hydroxybenzoicus DSM 7310]
MKSLYFDVAEYKQRIKNTKLSMEEKGIEVLIVTDPANMNYLSGFDGWSFYVHQCLIVMIDREEPIWVGRGQDGNAAKLTSWLSEENIRPYTDDYVHSLIKHPMDFVSDILKEKGYDNKVIATEMDAYYFTAKCQETLVNDLPNARFADGNNIVNWVKIIKSDKEIEYIKKAAVIVERTMQVAFESINVGVRQNEAAANVYHAQIYGTEEYGGDYASIVPLMPSGIRTSTPHLSWTDEPYRDGDTVLVEIAGNYRRYHCPLSRTIILGNAPQRVKDLSEVVVEGIKATLEIIKPGITCEDIERTWAKSIAKSGFIKDSRVGYSFGLNYPPDWGEHTVSLRPGDKTILKPNMTLHFMPGIWLDDCGVDISEPIRITETGVELLTNYPRKLLVK